MSDGDGHKVLVVDDEPDVLLLCRVNLEFEGYEVIEAADGETAMEQIRAERPVVVLLDVMMPKMDGWQV
ncbi:MAG: response regulator, partial [Nitriliruptoraceae bacterium]